MSVHIPKSLIFIAPVCRFRRRLPPDCRFSAIPFTTKAPVSSTFHPVSTANYRHFSTTSSSVTQNSALSTHYFKYDCRFAENKTRQIGNLNTVNLIQQPEAHKRHEIPNDAVTTYRLTTIRDFSGRESCV